MNRKTLLLKMLPGLLPIIVFVLIDEIFGLEAGLLAALAFGVAELLWTWFRERRFEKFILFDLLLLGILAGISFILKDATFFKLKPAILAALLTVFLGVAAFINPALLAAMAGRAIRGTELSEEGEGHLRSGIRAMFWVFVPYTALCFFAAFRLSKGAWAFITGPGFFIAAALSLLWQLGGVWLKRYKYRNDEWFDLVDPEGRIIGAAPRSLVHGRPDLLHPVVHLHVFSGDGRLLLQKRAPWKDVQPGKWDTAVGGHIGRGEALESALRRETKEELGIELLDPVFLFRYVNRTEIESELVHAFAMRNDGPFVPQESEISEVRFFSRKELESSPEGDVFTPNFLQELNKLDEMECFGEDFRKHLQRL